jgi:hypothetical protein
MYDAAIHSGDTSPEWPVIREDIHQWVSEQCSQSHGDGSQFFSDIEDACPGQTWLEIAAWIVGSATPNILQQRLLWLWVQTRRRSVRHSRSRRACHA